MAMSKAVSVALRQKDQRRAKAQQEKISKRPKSSIKSGHRPRMVSGQIRNKT